MASKVLLVLAVLLFVAGGHLPKTRELRNPDAEGGPGGGRILLLSKRAEA